jgi:hypothetical protein
MGFNDDTRGGGGAAALGGFDGCEWIGEGRWIWCGEREKLK